MNWKFWKKQSLIPADFKPDPSIFNTCMRIEHDITHDPYGLGMDKANNQKVLDMYTTEPLWKGVLKGVEPTLEIIEYARSGEYRKLRARQKGEPI